MKLKGTGCYSVVGTHVVVVRWVQILVDLMCFVVLLVVSVCFQ